MDRSIIHKQNTMPKYTCPNDEYVLDTEEEDYEEVTVAVPEGEIPHVICPKCNKCIRCSKQRANLSLSVQERYPISLSEVRNGEQ